MNRIKDEKLLKLYCQGLTNREIAGQLRVTQPAVHYRLQKLQLPNNCHEKQVIETEKVKQLHDMGLTTVGIALLLETSVLLISQHLQYMGLQDNYYRLKEIVQSG